MVGIRSRFPEPSWKRKVEWRICHSKLQDVRRKRREWIHFLLATETIPAKLCLMLWGKLLRVEFVTTHNSWKLKTKFSLKYLFNKVTIQDLGRPPRFLKGIRCSPFSQTYSLGCFHCSSDDPQPNLPKCKCRTTLTDTIMLTRTLCVQVNCTNTLLHQKPL